MNRAKKLQGNGMWESSRMMLPEHKEAILRHRSKLEHKERPILDEQRLEELSRQLTEAMQTESIVQLEIYSPYEKRELVGRIKQIDAINSKIKLTQPQRSTWIRLADILNITDYIP